MSYIDYAVSGDVGSYVSSPVYSLRACDHMDEHGIPMCNSRRTYKIKDVIFNPPATIVFWDDGTKTVVKAHKDDIYSQTWGLMFCFAKKLLGSGHQVRKMLDKYSPSWGDEISLDNYMEDNTFADDESPTLYDLIAQMHLEKEAEAAVQPKCDTTEDMDDANYMIFHDKETTARLEEVLSTYGYVALLDTYHQLNNWKLPMELASAINFPTYLYVMFNNFDIPVKEKTITPLIKFVSCEIAKREHQIFLEEMDEIDIELEEVEYTWEKRNHIEH